MDNKKVEENLIPLLGRTGFGLLLHHLLILGSLALLRILLLHGARLGLKKFEFSSQDLISDKLVKGKSYSKR